MYCAEIGCSCKIRYGFGDRFAVGREIPAEEEFNRIRRFGRNSRRLYPTILPVSTSNEVITTYLPTTAIKN
jgi:hypothetical protein